MCQIKSISYMYTSYIKRFISVLYSSVYNTFSHNIPHPANFNESYLVIFYAPAAIITVVGDLGPAGS